MGQFLKTEKSDLVNQLGVDLGIKWHFIAAYSPHHGGIWEAGIKAAKQILLKVLETSPTKFTYFIIFITLSNDPNNLSALTPSHFLLGCSSVSLPYPDLVNRPTNRLDLYEQIDKLKQCFWNRWSTEYITQLQQRQKWTTNQRNLSVGELVLLQDNNLPPHKWTLGRLSAVHPGADGVVRGPSVKTANGEFRRAVVKLAPLPIDKRNKVG